MRSRTMTLLLAALIAPSMALASEPWPQLGGPARDGHARPTTLTTDWTEHPPREQWRRAIGSGFSGIAVAGDRLFTMATDGADGVALALDPRTGATIWRTRVGQAFENSFGDGPRTTPTVDGSTVFVVSADAQLMALATDDGAVRWHVDLATLHDGGVPRFGYAASPLVDGDRLIVEVGRGEDGDDDGKAAIASLDKGTGAVRWSVLDGQAGYSSPIAVEIAGVRQYVFLRRQGPEALAIAANDGRVLWRRPGARAGIATPLFLGPDRVFFSSSDNDFGGLMVRVVPNDAAPQGHEAAGDTATEAPASEATTPMRAEAVWTNPRMRNHFNGSVVVDGHLYGFDNATFRCLDADTGAIRWAHRGFGKGSLIAHGGQLIVLGDDGTLALADASPEAYRERGRLQAMEGKAWTAPTLAQGVLYLRDLDEVVAYDLRPPRATPADAPSTGGMP